MSETAKCAREGCGKTLAEHIEGGRGLRYCWSMREWDWMGHGTPCRAEQLGHHTTDTFAPLPEEDAAIRSETLQMYRRCELPRPDKNMPYYCQACGTSYDHRPCPKCFPVPASPPAPRAPQEEPLGFNDGMDADCECETFVAFGFCVHTCRNFTPEEAKRFDAINSAHRAKVAATGEGEAPTPNKWTRTHKCSCGGEVVSTGGMTEEGERWGGNCDRCGKGYGENGDGPPIASCLVCGHLRPLAAWDTRYGVGVCTPCRDAGLAASLAERSGLTERATLEEAARAYIKAKDAWLGAENPSGDAFKLHAELTAYEEAEAALRASLSETTNA